jgi:Flp pilus assembly protein TadG
MLVGIIEFARAWNEHQVITDAAREAARKAAINDPAVTEQTVINVAKSAMAAAGINPNRNGSSITAPGWDGGINTPVTVNINLPYRFTFFGPLVKWATGTSLIMLRTSVTMRNEQ